MKGFTQLRIEIDSLVLISILLGKTNSPSGICREVEELLKLKHHFVVVSHIYREGNQVADFLSKLGPKLSEIKIFSSSAALPCMIRGSWLLHKLGMSFIRRRCQK